MFLHILLHIIPCDRYDVIYSHAHKIIRCFQVFVIVVEDTNNNAPQFLPTDNLAYTIYTPTPPGTTITGCLEGIVVRDIDLTTQRIDFTIQDNPYFEIEYDASASTTAKEFIGIIKTTTFIRTLPEPITLTITATVSRIFITHFPPLNSKRKILPLNFFIAEFI